MTIPLRQGGYAVNFVRTGWRFPDLWHGDFAHWDQVADLIVSRETFLQREAWRGGMEVRTTR